MALSFNELKTIDDTLTPEVELGFRRSWYDSITDENTYFSKFALERRTDRDNMNIAWDEAVAYADDLEIHQKGPDFVEPSYDYVNVTLKKQVSRGIRLNSVNMTSDFAQMAMRQVQAFPRIIRNVMHEQFVDALENGTAAPYTMADAQPLFSNSHEVGFTKAAFDNLQAGALTGANVAAMIDILTTVPMGPNGEPFLTRGMLDIYLIVPNELRYTALEIQNNTLKPDATFNTENIFQGIVTDVIVEERLTDPNDWYLIANGPNSEPFIWLRGDDPMSDRLLGPTDPVHVDELANHEWALWSYKSFGRVFPINYWQMIKVVN